MSNISQGFWLGRILLSQYRERFYLNRFPFNLIRPQYVDDVEIEYREHSLNQLLLDIIL